MSADEHSGPVLGPLRALVPELGERYGVDTLEVFGSRVRADVGRESDLDLLNHGTLTAAWSDLDQSLRETFCTSQPSSITCGHIGCGGPNDRWIQGRARRLHPPAAHRPRRCHHHSGIPIRPLGRPGRRFRSYKAISVNRA
jgi:predicted nucleotidyltransferase